MQDVAIVVSVAQTFDDIWGAQASLLNKYWPDREWPTYFLTDTNKEKVSFPGIKFVQTGDDPDIDLRKRFELFLSQTDAEYVLITLGDFFLTKTVKDDDLKKLIGRMEKEGLSYIRLSSHPKPRRKDKIKSEKGFYNLDFEQNYMVNLTPGLWRVEFLRHVIEKSNGQNGWYFEASMTKFAKECGIKGLVSLSGEYEYIDGIGRGRLFRKAYRYLKKNNLYDGNRTVWSRCHEIIYFTKLFLAAHMPRRLLRALKAIGRKHGHTYYSD